jgi:hypothetical protein
MKVIIHCLNVMVTACVMNQSKGHWLLLNALAIVIILIVVMQFEANPLDGIEIFDQFDVNL